MRVSLGLVGLLVVGLAVLPPMAGWTSRVRAQDRAVMENGAYKKSAGPWEVVQVAELKLHDEKRNMDLSVRVRGPKLPAGDSAPLPMVVFSHGAGGSSVGYPDLCAHLASHGYIVVNPTHSDSIALRRAAGEKFDLTSPDIFKQVVGKVNLPSRVDDVKLILDSFAPIEKALSDAVKDAGKSAGASAYHIDPQRLAMAGHSAGAMTAQTLAGVRFYGLGNNFIARLEPRFKAFVLVSGQGTSYRFFHEDSWRDVKSPMLVITGSKDTSPASPHETPQTRREPYDYAPAGDKYLLFIDGATHSGYFGKAVQRLDRVAPQNPQYIQDITRISITAFLDAYVKNDPAAKTYLLSDAITQYPGGKTEYAHK